MTTAALQALLDSDFTAAQSGDVAAFTRLVQGTQRMVTSVALAVTRDVSLSEDIAQETFLSAWRRLGAMQHAESLLPWLRQVARNRAIDHVRRARYQEVVVDSSDQRLAAAIALDVEPDVALSHEQERALLARALDDIPDASREVLLLFYREGQSSQSVATLLGMSDSAVRKRLQRARESLQGSLLAVVAGVADRSAPGIAFTATVTSALSASPQVASAAGAFATGTAGKWLLGSLGGIFAALTLVLAAVAWEVRGFVRKARNPLERQALLRNGIVYASLMSSYVVMLWVSKHWNWEFSTLLSVAICYSAAIILLAVQRVRIQRRHRPQ